MPPATFGPGWSCLLPPNSYPVRSDPDFASCFGPALVFVFRQASAITIEQYGAVSLEMVPASWRDTQDK